MTNRYTQKYLDTRKKSLETRNKGHKLQFITISIPFGSDDL